MSGLKRVVGIAFIAFGIWSCVVVTLAGTTEQIRTSDDKLADITKTLPGFGGYFIDEQGWLNIYLLNPDQTTPKAARAALEPLYGSRGLPTRVRLIKGTYGFLQLTRWADRVFRDVLSLPDVVSTDIDEGRNRLVIGISSEAPSQRREELMAEIEGVIARREIPRAAIVIEEKPPIRLE